MLSEVWRARETFVLALSIVWVKSGPPVCIYSTDAPHTASNKLRVDAAKRAGSASIIKMNSFSNLAQREVNGAHRANDYAACVCLCVCVCVCEYC